MKTVSAEQMREMDRYTIEDLGVKSEVLMERAGRGVAACIQRLADHAKQRKPKTLCIAGPGNNGGDAFVAARYLNEWGFEVEVWLVAESEKLKGDARKNFERLAETGVVVEEFPEEGEWERLLTERPFRGVIVDGMLGTGSTGAPRGASGAAVSYVNANSGRARVVAVDVPTGLDADTGEVAGGVVHADVSCTMAMAKKGMLKSAAIEHVGRVEVVDIGIPETAAPEETDADAADVLTDRDVASIIGKRRTRVSHKGTYGRVLIVGGAVGYSGAVSMAAVSALRAGTGLVTALVPASIAPTVASSASELIVRPGKETDDGALSPEIWPEWERSVDQFDAVLLGPGLTRSEESLKLVRDIIRDTLAPLVVDADALAVLEGGAHWFERCRGPVVITPHPGEMAKLLLKEIEEVQNDRQGIVREAAEITKATVVLKGAGTCIAKVERPLVVNMNGNPGMATGGTGDVLAGMISGLIGQGVETYDAARAGVYLHGLAGDRAAFRLSESGLIAGDIIGEIPKSVRELSPR